MTNYQVTANSLNVRKEPKLTGEILGYLSLDQIVEGISISGDGYWYKIRTTDGMEGWSSHKFLAAYDGEIEDEEFPWMPIALREIGVKEYAGAADNPRIVEYLSSTTNLTPLERSNDETRVATTSGAITGTKSPASDLAIGRAEGTDLRSPRRAAHAHGRKSPST